MAEETKLSHSYEMSEEVVYKPTTTSEKLLPIKSSEEAGGSGFLYVSAFAACLIVFVCGISLSWTSPVIPKLNGNIDPENNPLPSPITAAQESWIAGLLCLGAAIGPFIAGKAADTIGRKRTLQYLALPMLLSYITLALSHYVQLFYAARFLLGIGLGGVFSVLPMYLGEISQDHNRGTVGCLLGVFISSGLLFSFAVGPFLTVKIFTLTCCIPLVLFLVMFSLIPESPQFLASVGNSKGAENSLMRLRGKSESGVQSELKALLIHAEETTKQGGVKELFQSPGLRRGFTVTAGLMILQQLAGINAVLAYMQSIFDASGSGLSSSVSTILIGVVQIAATVVTSMVVEKLGRKSLLIFSTAGSCLSIVLLGIYFYLKTKGNNIESLYWLPVACLLVYIVTFNLGLGPLPWAIMGELFPPNIKSVASTMTTFTAFFAAFLITFFFPIMMEFLGMAQSFWVFGGCCFVGLFFIVWVVPETKGKTPTEIQMILSRGKD